MHSQTLNVQAELLGSCLSAGKLTFGIQRLHQPEYLLQHTKGFGIVLFHSEWLPHPSKENRFGLTSNIIAGAVCNNLTNKVGVCALSFLLQVFKLLICDYFLVKPHQPQ